VALATSYTEERNGERELYNNKEVKEKVFAEAKKEWGKSSSLRRGKGRVVHPKARGRGQDERVMWIGGDRGDLGGREKGLNTLLKENQRKSPLLPSAKREETRKA